MAVPMTSLSRAPNGDWFARKGIPKDIREAYKAAFGVSQEERFRRPSSLSVGTAKAELRDWDATVTGRIETLRAAARGEGRGLTHREAHGLAGQWYVWFVSRHEQEPGQPEQWDHLYERLEEARERFSNQLGAPGEDDDAPESPATRRHVRQVVTELGQVASFLGEQGIRLTQEATDAFLDIVEGELSAATATLRRRADGDYTPDARVERHPEFHRKAPEKRAGLTPWSLFEAWIKERKPGAATVNRWRAVMRALDAFFEGRDIAAITPEDALAWKDTLVTPERSASVVNDVWLRAARVNFGWALDNKRITVNPFDGVSVAVGKAPQKVREREFEDAEWATILRATTAPQPPRMAAHNAAARRWVPWLCAYTGSRPGEVTQLRAEDIQQHKAGFWVMKINPEAGTVKGGQARVVPIHPHIIEQGFLAFVQGTGKGPLFYDPEGQKVERDDPTNPVQAPWVKQRNKLAEWVRGLGVTDPNISPNHAWRHTFKRRAARAGIERRIRFAFCGHSSSDVGDEYETPTVEDMAKELERLPRYAV
ncbi:integrase family protein [Methylobacterium nodulans ORS 2060]|uniref:Integrase family protein n=2 Tax=Methylobacterium nodulans TaxID=114616 RepID=B8IPE9_METNO|nr:integrase family protein [Methylobacterium nodulans ORS 2060]